MSIGNLPPVILLTLVIAAIVLILPYIKKYWKYRNILPAIGYSLIVVSGITEIIIILLKTSHFNTKWIESFEIITFSIGVLGVVFLIAATFVITKENSSKRKQVLILTTVSGILILFGLVTVVIAYSMNR